jgi:L-malate glycosyltransferase
MDPAELERVRAALGSTGKNVCVFAGGMYGEKRLAFLLEACELVRAAVPDFEMIFVGSGEDAGLVEEAARRHEWIHYVGPKFTRDLVPYFMLSKLLLMPGLVGLVVLDSFACEIPLVTTAVTYHSPEIEYLEHGVNGWRVEDPDDVRAYASAVARLLRDDTLRARLVAGCRVAATKYTVENMVERFAVGVLHALERRR